MWPAMAEQNGEKPLPGPRQALPSPLLCNTSARSEVLQQGFLRLGRFVEIAPVLIFGDFFTGSKWGASILKVQNTKKARIG